MNIKRGMARSSSMIKLATYCFTAMGFICVVSLFLVISGGFIYAAGKAGVAAIISSFTFEWLPDKGKYGILPMVTSSLVVATIATAIAAPLAFGIICAIWIYNNKVSLFLRGLMRFMSGIPTVVYGFCGLFILIPLLRNIWGGNGYNILIVSFVLSLLILPTMTLIADSALYPLLNKPATLTVTASALGLSREQSFLFIAFYVQRKWIATGALLAFGRALGDTLIALMLSGNTPVLPTGLLSSVRVLSAHITLLTATEITSQAEFTLFLSGVILFVTALSISLFTRHLRKQW